MRASHSFNLRRIRRAIDDPHVPATNADVVHELFDLLDVNAEDFNEVTNKTKLMFSVPLVVLLYVLSIDSLSYVHLILSFLSNVKRRHSRCRR